MTYSPLYPGGFKDDPDHTTPITAAALARVEAALVADDTSIAGNAASIATHTAAIAAMLQKVAGSGLAGYTLINGTGNILTWNVPNDGALHRVMFLFSMWVGANETGGQFALAGTAPNGNAFSLLFQGGATAGFKQTNLNAHVQPGSTVTWSQNTALTAGGPSTAWGELWAS